MARPGRAAGDRSGRTTGCMACRRTRSRSVPAPRRCCIPNRSMPEERPMIRAMNHFTVLAEDLDETLAFYVGVLGLEPGPRPDLGFPGAWLYACLLYTSPSPRD